MDYQQTQELSDFNFSRYQDQDDLAIDCLEQKSQVQDNDSIFHFNIEQKHKNIPINENNNKNIEQWHIQQDQRVFKDNKQQNFNINFSTKEQYKQQLWSIEENQDLNESIIVQKKIKKNKQQKIYRERENNQIAELEQENCYYYQIIEYLMRNNVDQKLQTYQNIDNIQEMYQQYYDKHVVQAQERKKYTKHSFQDKGEYQKDLKKRNNQTATASRQKKVDKIQSLKNINQNFIDLIINIPIQVIYQFDKKNCYKRHIYCICGQNTTITNKQNISTSLTETPALQLKNQLLQSMDNQGIESNSSNFNIEIQKNQSDTYSNEFQSTLSYQEDQQQQKQKQQQQQQQQILSYSNSTLTNAKLFGSGILMVFGLILVLQFFTGTSILHGEQFIQGIMDLFKGKDSQYDYSASVYKLQQQYLDKKQQWEKMQCKTVNQRYNDMVDQYDTCIQSFYGQLEILELIGDIKTIQSFDKREIGHNLGQRTRNLKAIEADPSEVQFLSIFFYNQNNSKLFNFLRFKRFMRESKETNQKDQMLQVQYNVSKCMAFCKYENHNCFSTFKQRIDSLDGEIENKTENQEYIFDFMVNYLNYLYNNDLNTALANVQSLQSRQQKGIGANFSIIQYTILVEEEIYLRIKISQDYQYCTKTLEEFQAVQKELLVPNSISLEQTYRTYQMCSYMRFKTEFADNQNQQQQLILEQLEKYKDYNTFLNNKIQFDDSYNVEKGIISYFL